MINKVILVGNLGRDPEIRQTQGGSSVCTLSVATAERQKDRDGNWTDHTEWHRVVCFGQTADACARFLAKGRQVYVEGKLRTNKWTDKDGNDRYTTEVIAFEVKFLGGASGDGGNDRRGNDRGRDSDDDDRGNRRSEPDRGRGSGSRREPDRGRDGGGRSRDPEPSGGGWVGGDDGIPF